MGGASPRGAQDHKVKIWNVASGQEVLSLSGHTDMVYSVAFSPDGRHLASAGAGTVDGPEMIRLWQAPADDEAAAEVLPALRSADDLLFWHLGEFEESVSAGQRFAARWHMVRLDEAAPEDATLCVRLGSAYGEFGLWSKAAAAFGRATKCGPIDCDRWLQYALACLKAHDEAAYGRACRTLVESLRQTPRNRRDNHLAAWTCAVGPAAVTDYEQPLAWAAQFLAKLSPEDDRGRQSALNTLAALLYRAGRYPEALDRSTAAIAAAKGGPEPLDWVLLAMIHQRLGHTAEAQSSLGRVRIPTPAPEARLSWDSLELELLHDEAESDLAGKRD